MYICITPNLALSPLLYDNTANGTTFVQLVLDSS